MSRTQGRKRWAKAASSFLDVRARKYLRLAAVFAKGARRNPSLLDLAWGYLRLAEDIVRMIPEPET